MIEAFVGGTIATILDYVGSAVSKATETEPVRDWLSGCKNRLIAGRSLPGNHDLVRGIRTAHLCALDAVARRHAKLIEQLPEPEIGPDEEPFASSLRLFLDARLKVVTSQGIDHNVLTIEDIDHVLDYLVDPSTAEGFAAKAASVRKEAIARALAEIESDAGRPAPPLFKSTFAGEFGPGWYNAFALYVSEELKTNERFRSIFFAAELIDIKQAIALIDTQIKALHQRYPDLREFTDDFRRRLEEIADLVRFTPQIIVDILESRGFITKIEKEALESEKTDGDSSTPFVVKSIAKSKTLRLVYDLDKNAYVDDEGVPVQNIPFTLFEEWWTACPTGFLCAFQGVRLIAIIGMFPVTEDWATDFIARRKSEFDLNASIIRKSSKKFWYFSGLSSTVPSSGLLTHLPNILGFGILEWARLNLNAIRTKDLVIVAEGTSPVGEHLLHDLFRFDLKTTARAAGEYPRFSKKTSLLAVKNTLLGHAYFRKCHALHKEVAIELSEVGAPDR
jgi:hypothetical protein